MLITRLQPPAPRSLATKQTYFHGSSILHKGRLHLVLQVINLLRKVKLWRPWLYAVLLAKWDPSPRKLTSFRQCVKKQHWRSIIRHITTHLLHWIIHRQNWQNRVCRYNWRFLKRVHSTHKYIDWGQPVWLTLTLKADGQAVKVGFSTYWVPFGELV